MDISTAQKLLRLAFGLFIFLGCLLIGYQIGLNIMERIPAESLDTPTLAPTIIHPKTLQHNILLVIVDNIDSSDWELISTILIIKHPGEYHYTFLPIYPNKNLADPSLNVKLKDAMSSKPADAIPNTFWNLLSNHQFFWDDYILTDLKTLDLIIQSIGLEHNEKNPDSLVGSAQLGWIQNTCHSINEADHLGNITPEIISRIHTNIPESQIIAQWLEFRQKFTALQCEFPINE